MHEVATNREEFLHNFYTKSARSVAKAHNEGPAAYVLPADDPRPGQQARLLKVMEDHAFEVQRADEDIEIGETVYPEGSYVVRMDQPFSRGADMLLDKQYYNPDDPRPYDDAGWTVGPLFNAKTVRVEDTAILDADMTLVETVTVDGGVEGRRRGTHLLNYNADNTLAAFRVAHDDLVIQAAESPFADARDLGEAGVEAFREAQEEDEDDTPQSGGDSIGPDRVRVVMRFAQSTEDLLISGGLRNGQTLANGSGGGGCHAGRRPCRAVLVQSVLAVAYPRVLRAPLQHAHAPWRAVGGGGGDGGGGGGGGGEAGGAVGGCERRGPPRAFYPCKPAARESRTTDWPCQAPLSSRFSSARGTTTAQFDRRKENGRPSQPPVHH